MFEYVVALVCVKRVADVLQACSHCLRSVVPGDAIGPTLHAFHFCDRHEFCLSCAQIVNFWRVVGVYGGYHTWTMSLRAPAVCWENLARGQVWHCRECRQVDEIAHICALSVRRRPIVVCVKDDCLVAPDALVFDVVVP